MLTDSQYFVSPISLNTFLESVYRKNYASKKINELFKKASSFGINFCLDSFSLQIKMLIEQISFIQNQVSDVENEIEVLLEKLISPITTIPGIGSVNAAIILGKLVILKDFLILQNLLLTQVLIQVYHNQVSTNLLLII